MACSNSTPSLHLPRARLNRSLRLRSNRVTQVTTLARPSSSSSNSSSKDNQRSTARCSSNEAKARLSSRYAIGLF